MTSTHFFLQRRKSKSDSRSPWGRSEGSTSGRRKSKDGGDGIEEEVFGGVEEEVLGVSVDEEDLGGGVDEEAISIEEEVSGLQRGGRGWSADDVILTLYSGLGGAAAVRCPFSRCGGDKEMGNCVDG